MTQPRIQLQSVEKTFAAKGSVFTAVEMLDLAINPGEFVVLVGPSGCGKTTTLRMIAGLESPTSGQVLIDGRDVTALRPGDRDIAFVFQMFALYPHMTAEENIAFPLRASGLPDSEIRARRDRVIARLGLEAIRHQKPAQLAGGDQQRISLARAMVREPKAFLMDEPLGTLDADQREHTRTELRAIHRELGATTVFVTHDQLEAMSLADRIAVMNNGKLLQYASPEEIYHNPADVFVADFIGSPAMNLLPAAATSDGYRIGESDLVIPRTLSGQKLTLGIRPEFVTISNTGAPAIAEHTQRLGSYNLVTLKLPGQNAGHELTLKARISARDNLAENQPVKISFATDKLRWFNTESGKAEREILF